MEEVIFLNKDRFLRLLIELFSKYESMITLHSAVISELLAVLKGAGVEGQFLSKLEEYLFNPNSYGDDAIKGKGAPMEHLAGEAPLCSMRFPFTSSNVRILFVYQEGHLYLLAAFYERAGKKKTSYSAYTPIARQRLEELLKER